MRMARPGRMEDEPAGFSVRDAIITGCVVGGLILIIIIILLLMWCRRRFNKRSGDRMAMKHGDGQARGEEEARYNTTSNVLTTNQTQLSPQNTSQTNDELGSGEGLNVDVPMSITRRLSGYSNRVSDNVIPVKFNAGSAAPTLAERVDACKMDEKRLKILDVVGRSTCGIVYKGKFYDKHFTQSQSTLIKTIHGECTCETEVARFLEDILQLEGFSHAHVLPFIGVVLRDEQPHSLQPYPDNGILYTFITSPHNHFTVKELLRMSVHVARGMKYLSDEFFIHKDLATRNCVVDKHRTVLITDNALTRTMFESDYETVPALDPRPVPLRWMAFESVTYKEFTTKSDVWSYGVLLWEMMTRCEIPYADMVGASAIINSIQAGKHPERPPVCPDKVYEMMEACWREDADSRPTFSYICDELEALLNSKTNQTRSPKVRGTKSQYLKVIHAAEH